MRWLFLFVLVVNIVYVSWELSLSSGEQMAEETSSDIPTIELLSEIGQATKNPAHPAARPSVSARQKMKVATSSSKAGSSKPAKSKPAYEPEAPTGVDRCYTLGPFRELDKLRQFTRAIKDYVIAASFRSREEQEQSLFWVFLEPESSVTRARLMGKRLKDMKVKDYYVISDGPKKNGISLGHFKQKEGAYAHADRIKALGFEPKVDPVFKSYTIYWLDYKVPGDKVIPQKIFAKNLDKKINRLNRVCS